MEKKRCACAHHEDKCGNGDMAPDILTSALDVDHIYVPAAKSKETGWAHFGEQ
jgi:hypothetical protein